MSYSTQALQNLQQEIVGTVLTSDSADYETTRRGWDLSINHHPAVILVAASAQDVVTGVRFARENSLPVAIQSTGHGIQHPANDSLLIVTSRMKGVAIDPQARTARVEAGVVWKDVLDAATPYGLGALVGSSPHVGVVGYTLGGGLGWLSRKYGFAADHVRWIEIVTADGVLRRASATENSELFWGLRGGSGNFGVVTALEFDLVPHPSIYGGSLIYPGEVAGDAFRFFRDWVESNPDELTSSIAVFKFPSVPVVPEPLRGKVKVFVRGVYTGSAAEGQARIQPWLDWRAPEINGFAEMPFARIGEVSNDPTEPSSSFGSVAMFDTLSDQAIDLIVQHVTDPASPFVFNDVRHAGGAVARHPAESAAVSNRDARFVMQMLGFAPTPEIHAAVAAYTRQYQEKLRPHARASVYLNFLTGGEARQRISEAYPPATLERLQALKARYDPENRFRFSYQIASSTTPEAV